MRTGVLTGYLEHCRHAVMHHMLGGWSRQPLRTPLYPATPLTRNAISRCTVRAAAGGRAVVQGRRPPQEEPEGVVVEISAPIEYDGLFDVPTAANLTGVLERAGCKTFAALVASSGVLKTYQAAMDKGLTLFAPNDAAFLAKGAPDVKKMRAADLLALLEYHALPAYYPKASLKWVKAPLPTLATTKPGKFDVSVKAQGEDVSLDTGVRTSRVASTVLDSTPFCLLTVDSLLLPSELFTAAPAPAPAAADAPADSPPAPLPADAPSSKAADHHKKNLKVSSAAASRAFGVFVAAACSVVMASLL
ncbi:hypothetical protein ACP4OV_002432 [Aristida adscensionis]